jgi:hypothetical protein
VDDCKKTFSEYKLYDKLLVTWVKLQDAGTQAQTLSTICGNLEKLLLVLQRRMKAKSM